jgi:hypothetical protein
MNALSDIFEKRMRLLHVAADRRRHSFSRSMYAFQTLLSIPAVFVGASVLGPLASAQAENRIAPTLSISCVSSKAPAVTCSWGFRTPPANFTRWGLLRNDGRMFFTRSSEMSYTNALVRASTTYTYLVWAFNEGVGVARSDSTDIWVQSPDAVPSTLPPISPNPVVGSVQVDGVTTTTIKEKKGETIPVNTSKPTVNTTTTVAKGLTDQPEPTRPSTDTHVPTDTRKPADNPIPADTRKPGDVPTETRKPVDTPSSTDTRVPSDTRKLGDTPLDTRKPGDTSSPTDTLVPTDTRKSTETPNPTDTRVPDSARVTTTTRLPEAKDSAAKSKIKNSGKGQGKAKALGATLKK